MENQLNLFSKALQGFLKMLNNERGEVVVGNPEETEELNPDGSKKEAVVEEVVEEKLFAGRFKTPEELETGYKESSQEGIRLAQEVRRLSTELQQAKTPAKREEIRDKIDDLSKHFEPETAKILTNFVSGKIKEGISTALRNFQQETNSQSEFQTEVSKIWEETQKLYPEVTNQKSKLYIRANEILFERKLAESDATGKLVLLTPFAYRIAVEAASEELSRQAPEDAETQSGKRKANAVAGKGSAAMGKGKLTYEQYMKLPDEERDAYDKSHSQQ